MTNTARMARPITAIRKAAILISTLDTRTADALLDRMSTDQAAQVRDAVMELDDISAAEQDEILREFIASGGFPIDADNDGVELDASLARKLTSPDGYDDRPPVEPPRPAPFRSLCEAGVDPLARQLERQHPQLVAVVIAHLPAQRAAETIDRFSPKFQAEVLRRVAELDPADPEVIREIEQELEQLLSGEIRAARNRDVGLSAVTAILEAAGPGKNSLLDNLSRHERELASLLGQSNPTASQQRPTRLPAPVPPVKSRQPAATSTMRLAALPVRPARQENPRPELNASNEHQRDSAKQETIMPARAASRTESSTPTLQFEELVELADQEWAELIRAAESNIVLLALTGASEQLVARVTRQLPERESQALRARLEQVGPIRLTDIDYAQRRLAQCAEELAQRGMIRLPARRGFAAAA